VIFAVATPVARRRCIVFEPIANLRDAPAEWSLQYERESAKNADAANRNRKKLGSERQLTGFTFFSWQVAPSNLQERAQHDAASAYIRSQAHAHWTGNMLAQPLVGDRIGINACIPSGVRWEQLPGNEASRGEGSTRCR
jgi:hypothetical protein